MRSSSDAKDATDHKRRSRRVRVVSASVGSAAVILSAASPARLNVSVSLASWSRVALIVILTGIALPPLTANLREQLHRRPMRIAMLASNFVAINRQLGLFVFGASRPVLQIDFNHLRPSLIGRAH